MISEFKKFNLMGSSLKTNPAYSPKCLHLQKLLNDKLMFLTLSLRYWKI